MLKKQPWLDCWLDYQVIKTTVSQFTCLHEKVKRSTMPPLLHSFFIADNLLGLAWSVSACFKKVLIMSKYNLLPHYGCILFAAMTKICFPLTLLDHFYSQSWETGDCYDQTNMPSLIFTFFSSISLESYSEIWNWMHLNVILNCWFTN